MRIQIATKTMLLILILSILNVTLKTNAVISNKQTVSLKWSYKFANETGDIAMSSDGKYVIAGGYPSPLYFFNTSEVSEPLWSFMVSRGYVNTVSISSNGSYMVAGNVGGTYYEKISTVYLLDRGGNLLWTFEIASNHVYTAISPDGKYVAALGGGLGGGMLYLFSSGSLQWSFDITAYGDGYQVLFSRNGNYLYVGASKGILVFDTMKGQSGSLRFLRPEYVGQFSVSDDERNVACVKDSYVQFYKDSTLSWQFKTEEEMNGVDISSDGRTVVAGGVGRGGIGAGGVIKTQPGNVYFFRDGVVVGNYSTGDIPTVSGRSPISISSDGKLVTASGEDGVIYFFELSFSQDKPLVIPEPGSLTSLEWIIIGAVAFFVIAIIGFLLYKKRRMTTKPPSLPLPPPTLSVLLFRKKFRLH